MKTPDYFNFIRQRPDRAWIREAWIEATMNRPVREEIQADGRIRRWAMIADADNRY
jgi:hypothetical protein